MTNKFVSFLKKAGQLIASGAEVAIETIPELAPFIKFLPSKDQAIATTVTSTVSTDANFLLQATMSAEATGAALGTPGLSGAQKAAVAAVDIGQVFLNSSLLAGKKVTNPAAFNAAMVAIAGDVADAWNAFDGSALPNPPTPPAAAPTAPATV